MLEKLEKLERVFHEIVPFCRAGSNPNLTSKIKEAEELFIFLSSNAQTLEEEIKALGAHQDIPYRRKEWTRLGWEALDRIITSPVIHRIWANPFYVRDWEPFWNRVKRECT